MHLGAQVPFMRPIELASDTASSSSVVTHCLDWLFENESYRPDIVVLLQPTSPFRKAHHIDDALASFVADGNADSCVSVVLVPHQYNPYSVMKLADKYLEPFLPWDQSNNSRQSKPEFHARNGAAIYAVHESFFRRTRQLYGGNVLPFFMDKESSIDIDDLFDFEIAEYIVRKSFPPGSDGNNR